jgi:hypothetical protein
MPESAAPAPQADVGVLLVHGIGDHAEGDALLSFGEPLIDWVREWLAGPEGAPRGRVEVIEARLRAARTEAESPAYALAALSQGGQSECWLFTEAWWGESVKAPGTLRLLAWMFTRVPLLVMWHFFGGSRVVPAGPVIKPSKKVWGEPLPAAMTLPVKLVAVPPLVLAMQAAVLLAIVLWVIPIGPWRAALLAAVRALTLTLGDSYVLLEQEVQRAALVRRVDRCLEWVAERARKLVIIAHSQGGAIAFDALLAGRRIDSFISVGSGLEKLEFLRLVRLHRKGLFASATAAPLIAAGAMGVAAGALGWVERGEAWWFAPAALLLAGLALGGWLYAKLVDYGNELRAVLKDKVARLAQRCPAWHDFHATLDLVPMGHASMLPALGAADQTELRNECSLVSDHVRYFESWCGFCSHCWALLARQSGLPLIGEADGHALRRLGTWHSLRALGLGLGTLLSPLALVFAALFFGELLLGLGTLLFDALAAADMKWTQRIIEAVSVFVARLLSWLGGMSTDAASLAPRARIALALMLGVVVLLVWWALVLSMWRADSRARWFAASRGRSLLTGEAGWAVGMPMVAMWAFVAMLPLLTLLIVVRSPELLSFAVVGRAVALVLAWLALVYAVIVALAAGWFVCGPGAPQLWSDIPKALWPLFGTFAALFVAWIPQFLFWVAGVRPTEAPIAALVAGLAVPSVAIGLSLSRELTWPHKATLWAVPAAAAALVPLVWPETDAARRFECFAVLQLALSSYLRAKVPT